MDQLIDRIEMDVPTSLDMLTPQYLSDVLHTGVRSVRIIQDHIEGGLIGSIVRIGLEYDPENTFLPNTMVAKFSAFERTRRMLGSFLGAYEREVRFYKEIVGKISLRTPHCYYAAFDPVSQGSLLLLEDLTAYQRASFQKGCSISQTKRAVKEIARLHAAWWDNPELREMSWLYQPRALFPDGYAVLLAPRWDRFRVAMQLEDSEEIRLIGETILREVDAAGESLEASPITLTHNDYHLDNLFFSHPDQPQEVVVLDWGNLRATKGAADLAYFVVGSLSPDDRRSAEIVIINEYLEALLQAGIQGYTLAQCITDYKKAIILYLTRFIVAITGLEIVEETTDKPLDGAAFDFWDPIIQRYLTAIKDHYLLLAA